VSCNVMLYDRQVVPNIPKGHSACICKGKQLKITQHHLPDDLIFSNTAMRISNLIPLVRSRIPVEEHCLLQFFPNDVYSFVGILVSLVIFSLLGMLQSFWLSHLVKHSGVLIFHLISGVSFV
jgi:hypothetical protein